MTDDHLDFNATDTHEQLVLHFPMISVERTLVEMPLKGLVILKQRVHHKHACRPKFGGDIVVDIMRTHPMIIIGGILQENPFFVPPDKFLRELRARGPTHNGSYPLAI